MPQPFSVFRDPALARFDLPERALLIRLRFCSHLLTNVYYSLKNAAVAIPSPSACANCGLDPSRRRFGLARPKFRTRLPHDVLRHRMRMGVCQQGSLRRTEADMKSGQDHPICLWRLPDRF
jgi:hypothetical protein